MIKQLKRGIFPKSLLFNDRFRSGMRLVLRHERHCILRLKYQAQPSINIFSSKSQAVRGTIHIRSVHACREKCVIQLLLMTRMNGTAYEVTTRIWIDIASNDAWCKVVP